MRKLFEFRKMENAQRADKYDGISAILQPDHVTIEVNGEVIQRLAGPAFMNYGVSHENPFVYCMYGFTDACISDNGEHIDPENHEFGDTAVLIKDVEEFYRRLKTAFKKEGTPDVEGRLVEYVSYDKHHGEMGVFRKFDAHEHQSEFRLSMCSGKVKEDTYTLEIGSLEDIAIICPSDEINRLIRVN